MDFTENLTIELPNVEAQANLFSEQQYKQEHGLIVEVAAIHAGLTGNYNNYSAEELQKSVSTWVTPYPKPIIINHDQYSDPLGRVMAGKMEAEADGSPYISIQAAISSPDAMSRILDGRYLTGSVGGSAEQAICSVCGVDWANATMESIPCRHRRGKTYKGKLCYFDMRGITWKEYSFVNVPGDQRSGVKGVRASSAEESEELETISSARLFSLDMNNENVVEFSESADNTNILESMKKKEATPIYMNLKGAFLSSLAFAAAEDLNESTEDTDKESNVKNHAILEEEDDILEVTQDLSSDLNAGSVTSEEAEETVEEEVVEEEAGDSPEGQESPQQELPVSRESEESEEEVLEEETDSTEEEVAEEAGEEEVAEVAEEEDSEESMELNESADVETLESRIEELESANEAIAEENARLRAALKYSLAERVVDMKIGLGLEEAENRSSSIEEHVSRSASSLADSIRDLAAMPSVSKAAPRESYENAPKVEESSAPVLEEGEPVVTEADDTEIDHEEVVVTEDLEDKLYRVFNGAFLPN